MIASIAAVLLCSAAAAAPAAPPAAPAKPATSTPAVHPSTAAAPGGIGVSTYTVSTLYTGDRVRDPFLSASAGGPARVREKGAPLAVDIHAIQLRGILKDAATEFALFKMDDGTTLVLRDGHLYDDSNKRLSGITGRIQIKQKRAELITEDKDVQVYTLGESGSDEDKKAKP